METIVRVVKIVLDFPVQPIPEIEGRFLAGDFSGDAHRITEWKVKTNQYPVILAQFLNNFLGETLHCVMTRPGIFRHRFHIIYRVYDCPPDRVFRTLHGAAVVPSGPVDDGVSVKCHLVDLASSAQCKNHGWFAKSAWS